MKKISKFFVVALILPCIMLLAACGMTDSEMGEIASKICTVFDAGGYTSENLWETEYHNEDISHYSDNHDNVRALTFIKYMDTDSEIIVTFNIFNTEGRAERYTKKMSKLYEDYAFERIGNSVCIVIKGDSAAAFAVFRTAFES